MRLLLSITLLMLSSLAIGQCAFDEVNRQELERNPEYQANVEHYRSLLGNIDRKSVNPIVIPVVVHVIHIGEEIGEGTNISDEQVLSSITALNEDFRKVPGTNGDGEGVDTNIEFCLASIDPEGNPTNGIVRVDGSVVPDYLEDGITAGQGTGANEVQVKDLSRWPRTEYYNIWVVTEIEGNNGGFGIQGYAYFPWSSISRDGAVLLHNVFGTLGNVKNSFNMNRVTTHELGHAFFLYHIFQGNSCNIEDDCLTEGDLCCDTPAQNQHSSCTTIACDTIPLNNHMGYLQQTCVDTFTQDQSDRMNQAIQILRPGLLTSNGCDDTPTCDADLNFDGVVNVEDFLILNSVYGTSCDCPADLNGDGFVDVEDALDFNSQFGMICE